MHACRCMHGYNYTDEIPLNDMREWLLMNNLMKFYTDMGVQAVHRIQVICI